MSKKNEKELATTPQGGAVADYGVPEGAGFEGVGKEDMVLPRLNVLQALSPQVAEKPGDGGVEGAKAGMLHNSVTDELYDGDTGVVFIPASRAHVFTEWVPRKRGGGFVARHEVDSEVVAKAKAEKPEGSKFGKYSTDYSVDDKGDFKGNELVETFELYGVLLREDGPLPVVLTITSTKIKVYKAWMTSILAFRPKQKIPLFAHRVLITTTSQKHSEGTSYNIKLQPALKDESGKRTLAASLLMPGSSDEVHGSHDELLAAAGDIYEMVKQGQVRANYESGETEAGTAGTAGAAGGGSDDGEPPF